MIGSSLNLENQSVNFYIQNLKSTPYLLLMRIVKDVKKTETHTHTGEWLLLKPFQEIVDATYFFSDEFLILLF